MDLGEKIKYLRTSQGMTLEEVGDAVGVGKSTVRKWESGQIANMRRDKIALVAKALHVTPSYLMGWDEIAENLGSDSPAAQKLQEIKNSSYAFPSIIQKQKSTAQNMHGAFVSVYSNSFVSSFSR